MDTDFPSLMVPVVRRLRGNPNEELSTKEQLRWGTKGSLAVKVKEGVWYDHEMKEGGGCLDFIRRHISGDPFDWLRKERLIEGDALIATFDYRDEQDKLLFQVCRKANKGFWQRQPNRQWPLDQRSKRYSPCALPLARIARQHGHRVYPRG
jgi:hypothetical protein